MKQALKRFILITLNQCDGLPLPEAALISAVESLARPGRPTEADIQDALKDVESSGYVAGVSDDLTGRSWTLTTTGTHKARQLR
jgi:hypothetical protein